MLQSEVSQVWVNEWADSVPGEEFLDELPDEDDILETALMYLDHGREEKADELLTMSLLTNPSDHCLWLAVGIVRLRRGYTARAASAFQMASWLTGDPEASALLRLCNEILV